MMIINEDGDRGTNDDLDHYSTINTAKMGFNHLLSYSNCRMSFYFEIPSLNLHEVRHYMANTELEAINRSRFYISHTGMAIRRWESCKIYMFAGIQRTNANEVVSILNV